MRLNHVTVPALGGASIPDQSRALDAEADDEILHAVPVEIGDEIAGLLRGVAGHRQVAVLAGGVLPSNVSRLRQRTGEPQKKEQCDEPGGR